MTRIVLAEFAGSVWLVRGDEHFDDLLANVLSKTAAVEFTTCANLDEVRAMWREHGDTENESDEPWLLNPAIVQRIKGRGDARSVTFTPWSAMLDAGARDIVDGTAGWLQANTTARLLLRQFSPADAPAGMADLQSLRGQLLAGALARAGADAASLDHETQHSDAPDDIDRIELVTVLVTTE